MHRSGTTLLAKLLASAGVFMGRTLSANFESVFFQQLNRDILDPFGCSWAHVEELPPTAALFEKFNTLKKIVADRVITRMQADHFGDDNSVRSEWGWKDPRTCLTLPFLHPTFPDARLVFIYRDPRDVASSLIVRDERAYDKACRFEPEEARRRFLRYVALWHEYNRRSLEAMRRFATIALVRYEDLVLQPMEHMRALVGTLGLESIHELNIDVNEVRSNRRSVFEQANDPRFRGITIKSELYLEWYGTGPDSAGNVSTAGFRC